MRRTVTLDDDVAAAVTERARERGESFNTALNETLRAGLHAATSPHAYLVPARALGMRAGADLDQALVLAAEREEHEIVELLS